MNRIFFILSLTATLLFACAVHPANRTSAPVETEPPALSVTASPSETAATEPAAAPTQAIPSGKLPAAPFESRTYVNNTVGFILDYPAGWTVNEAVIGDRGSQIQFLSSADLATAATLPEDATRVSATVFQWDPKNDLNAFITHQKSAWDASGFKILEEESLTLELGLAATEFTVQTPDANVVFLVTAIGDRYLALSGEGDLELAKEIVQRIRPISP